MEPSSSNNLVIHARQAIPQFVQVFLDSLRQRATDFTHSVEVRYLSSRDLVFDFPLSDDYMSDHDDLSKELSKIFQVPGGCTTHFYQNPSWHPHGGMCITVPRFEIPAMLSDQFRMALEQLFMPHQVVCCISQTCRRNRMCANCQCVFVDVFQPESVCFVCKRRYCLECDIWFVIGSFKNARCAFGLCGRRDARLLQTWSKMFQETTRLPSCICLLLISYFPEC